MSKRLPKVKKSIRRLFVLLSALTLFAMISVKARATDDPISLVNHYDSSDTCVVVVVNEEAASITFRNHDLGKYYTLIYDQYTYFFDAKNRAITGADLRPGDLVEVTFLKSNKTINSLSLVSAEKYWSYSNLDTYKLPSPMLTDGRIDTQAILNGKNYLMDYRTLVLVDGEVSSASGIVAGDLISAVGIGNEVYCVSVTGGHGYLRLSSTTVGNDSLVGAWIELGDKIIRKIADGMMLTAPEGEYTLYIVGNGANWSTPVTIARGKEIVIDTSVIKIAEPKKGTVTFNLAPNEAGIIVDGRDRGQERTLTLEYGVHTLEVYAEGYYTEVMYLRVASDNATIPIVLTSDQSASQSSSSGSAGSSNTDTNTGSSTSGENTGSGTDAGAGESSSGTGASQAGNTGSSDSTSSSGTSSVSPSWSTTPSGISPGIRVEDRWIHVDAPAGAGLYVDSAYIGVVPVVFEKVSGIHVINLRRDGYKIMSYNIEVDTEKTDLYFRFPEMEAE